MPQHLSLIALLGTSTLIAACGSDPVATGNAGAKGTGGTAGAGGVADTDAAANTDGTSDAGVAGTVALMNCVSGENGVCHPTGFAFVTAAFPVTDWCAGAACLAPTPAGQHAIHLSQPEEGTLCLSGTVLPGTTFGALNIIFVVTSRDGTVVLKTFNAKGLNITKVAFTIDRLPAGGLSVNTGTIVKRECVDGLLPNCIMFGFELPVITAAGPQLAPFTDFSPSSGVIFDGSSISHIGFTVSGPGDYDFCVRDFRFLNANNVVVPEPPSGP
jgi:hypothetical protein